MRTINALYDTGTMRLKEVKDGVQGEQYTSTALASGGCLYLCGNGGSLADAMHISGEMLKSYTLPRPLEADVQARLAEAGPDGVVLGQALERGLRAVVLPVLDMI